MTNRTFFFIYEGRNISQVLDISDKIYHLRRGYENAGFRMTVIVGIAKGSNMYIGGDRAVSDHKYIQEMQEPKIATRKNCLLGYAGNIGVGQRFLWEFKVPYIEKAKHMHTRFIPALREFYADYAFDMENEAVFLVGFAGTFWEINLIDFSCIAHKETAIGSGAGVALGSLYSSKDYMQPKDRVYEAIEAACKYVTTCEKPIDLLVL